MERIFKIAVVLFVLVSLLALPGVGLAGGNMTGKEVKKEKTIKAAKLSKKQEKEEAYKLKEVVVTATRTEKDVLTVPADVTVLSHEKLVGTGGRNLVEALKFTAGLTYYAYGPMGISHGGMNSEIGIRGTRKETLVLVNGVPIATPTHGSYDLDQIPLNMVERVEIVRGAASTLYGSDAYGGVINIITRKPRDIKTSASAEGGNHDYYDGKVGFRYKNLGIAGSYKHLGDIHKLSQNYRRKYDYDFKGSDAYNAYLTYQLLDRLRLNYSYSYQKADFNRVYWNRAKALVPTEQEDDKHFVNLIYEENSLKLKGFFNYDNLKYRYVSKDITHITRSSTSGIDAQDSWQIGSGSQLLAGFTYKHDYGDTSVYGRHHRDNYAPFLQYSYKLFPELTIIVGARQQWVDRDKGEDQSEFCPQFQTIYEITPSFSWYVNIGKAFKMPTFTDLYYESPWMEGNPDLKPEKGWTYETGIKFRGSSFFFSLAPYYMKLNDKIRWEFNPATGKSSTANISEFTNKGVQYNFQYFINNNWKLSAGGYWGDPEGKRAGKEYQAGPKFQITPALQYQGEKLTVNLNATFITSREYGLKSFQTINANINYKLWQGTLSLVVDNILDRENVINGKMSPTRYYEYYDMPCTFRIGYRIAF